MKVWKVFFYLPFFLYLIIFYLVRKLVTWKPLGKKHQIIVEFVGLFFANKKLKEIISFVFWILFVYLLIK